MLCVVSVVLLTNPLAVCLGDDGLGKLPDWIPPGSVELAVNDDILIADGIEPQQLSLGQLSTGVSNYLLVPLVNMTSGDVSISEIKSSCGCLVAVKADEKQIAGRGRSKLLMYLQPQSKPGPFGKIVSLNLSGGQVLKILVSADYIPQYRAVPSRVVIDEKTTDFSFEIESRNIASNAEISLSPLDAFVEISNSSIDKKNRKVLVHCKVKRTTFDLAKSSGAVLQRFRIADQTTGRELSVLDLMLESKSFVVRPATIKLKLTDGYWSGRMMVFGDWKTLAAEGAELQELTVCFKSNDGSKMTGKAELMRNNSRMAIFNLKVEHRGGIQAQECTGVLNFGSTELCKVESIQFLEE